MRCEEWKAGRTEAKVEGAFRHLGHNCCWISLLMQLANWSTDVGKPLFVVYSNLKLKSLIFMIIYVINSVCKDSQVIKINMERRPKVGKEGGI